MNQTKTTSISPAAQAVLDAFTEDNCLHDWKHNHYNVDALAAALRAAADQVAPYETEIIDNCYYEVQNPMREKLLAIAAELEAAQ
jgi:hypothetical protein